MATDDVLPTAEELQDLLLESPGFSEFLLGLATISATLMGAKEPLLCAITVERAGGPSTVASSTDFARVLDEKQYDLDDGPCLTALRQQRTVLIADLPSDDQWRRYAALVSGAGVRAVLAVPIPLDNGAKGALNCYSTGQGSFDPGTVQAIERHAESMSRILRLALRFHSDEPYPKPLRSALSSRAVVDAAIALIMVQTRSSREGALSLIHLSARSSDARLHQVAAGILKNAGIEDKKH